MNETGHENRFGLLVRALRLPFIAASVLPYIYGALLSHKRLRPTAFALGLLAVGAGHLSANVLNDYADSRSGADWRDKTYRGGFFGGSKLIQSGKATERAYLLGSLGLALMGLTCVTVLALVLRTIWTIPLFLAAQGLAWSYSVRPLQLSYVRLGEVSVFILFGPVCVLAGWATQSVAWPDARILVLSLPMGLLTAAILLANEVPDRDDDLAAGKRNLVNGLPASRAWIPYALCSALGLAVAGIAQIMGYAGPLAHLSLIALLPVFNAARTLATHVGDKSRLMIASRNVLVAHLVVAVSLILDALL